MKRGTRLKFDAEHRAHLDRIIEARRKRKENEAIRGRQRMTTMEIALRDVWMYLVDPENRISNHDAERIVAIIKKGLGEA